MRHRVQKRLAPKPVTFTGDEIRRMRRLAAEGYGPRAIAREIARPADAVRIWLMQEGLVNSGRHQPQARTVTLPTISALEDGQ
jgi:hypothetical protein